MKKLGYIVSDRKINNIKEFVGFVNDISLADPTKPILIVGYENAKNNIKNFNILVKEYPNNIFWTYKKTEKRTDFDADIELFYKRIIDSVVNEVSYCYINILKLKYSKIKKLYYIMFSKEKKYIYISNNMVYIIHEDTVLGISLDMLDYCGINKDKIIKKLSENKNNLIYTDDSPDISNIRREVENKKYAIPYFMSMI